MLKTTLATAAVLLASAANAFDMNWMAAQGKQSVQVVAFQIPTSGKNLRGYEYKSPAGKVCTVTISSSKGMTSSCSWPKSCN